MKTNPEAIEEALTSPIEDIMEQNPDGSKKQVGEESIEDTLTIRQKRFCQLYATDMRFLGNGVQAYLEVYDVDMNKKNWYKTACVRASQLLSNVKVYGYINELLEEQGLNDQFADKQLLFLLSQHDDKGIKLGAYKAYNDLKQRVTKKIEHSGSVSLLKDIPTEELLKKLEED